MKTIIYLTTLSISLIFSVAQADGLAKKSDSWDRLMANSNVIFSLPNLQVEGWFLSANDLCVSGDKLRSSKKVEECMTREINERSDCTSSSFRYQPITSLVETCVQWETNERGDCLYYETGLETIALTNSIPVYKSIPGSARLTPYERATMYAPLFYKPYTIGPCQP